MRIPFHRTSTAIALAMAGLLAAGCASQTPSDNESVNNAGSGQSDATSQNNPLNAQTSDTITASGPTDAGSTTVPLPSGSTAQAALDPATSATVTGMDATMTAPTAPTATTPAYPATAINDGRTAPPLDAGAQSTRDASLSAEPALAPRADRN